MTRKLGISEYELDRRRRGNTTSGAERKGFKGGRKRLHPEGTVLHPVGLKLTDPEYALALWAGAGIATRGVRIALEAWSVANPLPPGVAQLDRFATETAIKRDKAQRRLSRLKAAAGIKDTSDDTSWLDL